MPPPLLNLGGGGRGDDHAALNMSMSGSYRVTEDGTLKLFGSSMEYEINADGLQRAAATPNASSRNRPSSGRDMQYQCSESDFMTFNSLGRGASSIVRKAIYLPTHRVLAIKVINVTDRTKRQAIMQEMKALCEAPQQPGLISFFGAFYSAENNQISIALEYCDCGSLADVLARAGKIPMPVLGRIAAQVVEGLAYLHTRSRMVHRDIKPGNILLSSDGSPKITDFGISTGLDTTLAKCATFVGTVTYMSPERIESQAYNFAADVWSLGLTLLECASGEYPYTDAGKGPLTLMMQIIAEDAPSPSPALFPPTSPENVEFSSFIAACLQKDPEKRPTAEALKAHPFVQRYAGAAGTAEVSAYLATLFDPQEALIATAQNFVAHYYLLFDGEAESRGQLQTLYRDESCLTFEGDKSKGPAAIQAVLQAKAASLSAAVANGRRIVRIGRSEGGVYVDAQPSMAYPGGLLVMVSGRITAMSGRPASASTGPRAAAPAAVLHAPGGTGAAVNVAFAEMFLLMPAGPGTFWVAHQVFRVVPETGE